MNPSLSGLGIFCDRLYLQAAGDIGHKSGGEGQKLLKSGEYTVTLSYGKVKHSQKHRVKIAQGIETR